MFLIGEVGLLEGEYLGCVDEVVLVVGDYCFDIWGVGVGAVEVAQEEGAFDGVVDEADLLEVAGEVVDLALELVVLLLVGGLDELGYLRGVAG